MDLMHKHNLYMFRNNVWLGWKLLYDHARELWTDIFTVFLIVAVSAHLAHQVGTTRWWKCQEGGSAISIDALNYHPTVMAQVVLIKSNYGLRNVRLRTARKIEITSWVLQAMHGGPRSVWLPSQGGLTVSWHVLNYPIPAVRADHPPGRANRPRTTVS